MLTFFQIGCCGFSNDDEGYKQWGQNMYFNCSVSDSMKDLNKLACAVPESCCKYKDVSVELKYFMFWNVPLFCSNYNSNCKFFCITSSQIKNKIFSFLCRQIKDILFKRLEYKRFIHFFFFFLQGEIKNLLCGAGVLNKSVSIHFLFPVS